MESTLQCHCAGKIVREEDNTILRLMTDIIGEILTVARKHISDTRAGSSSRNLQQDIMAQTMADIGQQKTNSQQPGLHIDQQAAINMVASNTASSAGPFANPAGLQQNPTTMADPLGFTAPFPNLNLSVWGFDDPSMQFVPDLAQVDPQDLTMDDPFLLLECGDWDWTS